MSLSCPLSSSSQSVYSSAVFFISFKLITLLSLIFCSQFLPKPIFNWLAPLLLTLTTDSTPSFLSSRSLELMLPYEIIIFRTASLSRCSLPTLSLGLLWQAVLPWENPGKHRFHGGSQQMCPQARIFPSFIISCLSSHAQFAKLV